LSQEALPDVERESWVAYEEYMRTTRININVRQVFPKGFDGLF
jgi:alkylated DNA repair protein alkB family protein 1